MALKPTVLIVTGDHSTPARLASHSWHPVPTLLVVRHLPDRRPARRSARSKPCTAAWASSQAMYLMPLALAHAERLGKFGA